MEWRLKKIYYANSVIFLLHEKLMLRLALPEANVAILTVSFITTACFIKSNTYRKVSCVLCKRLVIRNIGVNLQ